MMLCDPGSTLNAGVNRITGGNLDASGVGRHMAQSVDARRGADCAIVLIDGRAGIACAIELSQRLRGRLEIRSFETFGEPIVDRREQLPHLFALALLGSAARQGHGRSQFPRWSGLATCDLA